MKIVALVAAVIVVAGCTRTVDAPPVKEPQKVDCALIFPRPGGA